MADKKGLSRRDFLKTSGIATGALIGGGVLGGLIGYNSKKTPEKTVKNGDGHGGDHEQVYNRGRMFFTNNKDFTIISAAMERIFPEDDLGPGAIGLGAPYFIDNQLAGNYGGNAKEYMQGPFLAGESTQGYQSRLTRAEIFTQGIAKLEKEANNRFKKGFADIEGGQMDEILTAFQKDEVDMVAVSSAFFFRLLRSATLEGAYADPIYNGNNDMAGWKMKNFPGHQASYYAEIESEDFKVIEPKSLASMQH